MGFAKYHEDNLKICDERMYYRSGSYVPCIQSHYSYDNDSTVKYNYFCPFCKKGFLARGKMIDHVLASHGGRHEYVYVNNRKITQAEETITQIRSLILYSFRDETREIVLHGDSGKKYTFCTKPDIFEYDLQGILGSELYSEISIENIDYPVCIKQLLDIKVVSIEKIITGKYCSYLFDNQISEELLGPSESLIYLKMMIHEGEGTESFFDRVRVMNFDHSRDLDELYYYHFLHVGDTLGCENKEIRDVLDGLMLILNGEYKRAELFFASAKGDRNDIIGCQIIVGLLQNDKLGTDFLVNKYEPVGFIGLLERILLYYSRYEKVQPRFLNHEIDELSLFTNYPLIKSVINLYNSIDHSETFEHNSYSLLRGLTPLAAVQYCSYLDDESIREKILKSMVKEHPDSSIIKDYALNNEYCWLKQRISVSDGEIYRKAIKIENIKLKLFSEGFIDDFPFDGDIRITPLGGENGIGASCFIVSYKGYNIALDCGIDPVKQGDDAYPFLDQWNREIDMIVVSHAHIDHSGGVPKAHAMWPEAKIVCTAPTKVFLKYLYSDIAKIKNGINDEFEIENIFLQKDVVADTLNSIVSVEYEQWFGVGKDIRIRLHPAGHIVGAAMIELNIAGKTILYTGDCCNYSQALVKGFSYQYLPTNIDYLITETTYIKKSKINWNQQRKELEDDIIKSIKARKAILLPTASIGRCQELVCVIGEMKLEGLIPNDIQLCIAGMAIPSTTQIAPFMNDRYEQIIGLFEEFDGKVYPDENAIVVASSGAMTKGSASYNISKYWDNQHVKFSIISNGFLEEDSEACAQNIDKYTNVQRASLPSHMDLSGLLELIEYVSPKVVSYVHRGEGTTNDYRSLVSTCTDKFSGDLVTMNLCANRTDCIFDLYKWIMEGEING